MEDYPESLALELNKEQQKALESMLNEELDSCNEHNYDTDEDWFRRALILQQIKNMIHKDGYTIIRDIFSDYRLNLDAICNNNNANVNDYIKEIAKIIEEPDKHDPIEFFRAILYCCSEYQLAVESDTIEFDKFFSAMMDIDELYNKRRD